MMQISKVAVLLATAGVFLAQLGCGASAAREGRMNIRGGHAKRQLMIMHENWSGSGDDPSMSAMTANAVSGDEVMLPVGGPPEDSADAPAEGTTVLTVNATITYYASFAASDQALIPEGRVFVGTPAPSMDGTDSGSGMMTGVPTGDGTFVETAAPSEMRRRLQDMELTPEDGEIDTLIENTVLFYEDVYMTAFGSVTDITPTGVFTEVVAEGVFILNWETQLTFPSSTTPSLDDVIMVTTDIDEEEYIELYVKPSGPYFDQTVSINTAAMAMEAMDVPAPETASPTMAPTAAAVVATEMPTMGEAAAETASPTPMATAEVTVAVTEEVVATAAPTAPATEATTVAATAAETTMAPVEATVAPTPEATAAVTPAATDAVTEAATVTATTAAPEDAPVEETEAPTAMETAAATTGSPTMMAETEAPAPVEETAAPTEGEGGDASPATPSPTVAATDECAGRTARVLGTIMFALDESQTLTNPTEQQVVELAQHVLQDFGVILRDTYGAGIRGFSATIDETDTDLDGSAYPLNFDATILFSPCAPSPDEVSGVFADADYTAILETFEPTGEDNVFQFLTGDATYTGTAEIEA